MSHSKAMETFQKKKKHQLGMGGPDKLEARKAHGQLNARERLDRFFDSGTFREIGLFTHSSRFEVAEETPSDGKIIGHGQVNRREVLCTANDLTVMGASSAATNMRKLEYVRSLSCEKGLPLVFLGESAGARIPDTMGSAGMALGGQNRAQYRRLREAPWLSALLGPCYGSSSWYSAMSDVRIMLKGAVLAVSSPLVTRVAIGEDTPAEELGGWRVHAEITGMAHLVGETEEECLDLCRRVLDYLPSNSRTAPLPRDPVDPPDDVTNLLDILPEKSRQVYDIRQLIRSISDGGEFLELNERFARPCVTGMCRLAGRSVGIIANNPYYGAGALNADCCDKIIGFLVLCDSYNLPIVMLVDTPGFLVGKMGERQRVVGKIMNWMNALSLITVPVVTVIVGKSYGQAYLNMGAGKYSSAFAAWPTAQISFMSPDAAVSIVTRMQRDDDPERYDEALEKMKQDVEPWDAAGLFGLNSIIEPAETRDYLIRMIDLHTDRPSGGVGHHLLHNWPTTF